MANTELDLELADQQAAREAEAEYYRRYDIAELLESELRDHHPEGRRLYLVDELVDEQNADHEAEGSSAWWRAKLSGLEGNLHSRVEEQLGSEKADELQVERLYTDRVRRKI